VTAVDPFGTTALRSRVLDAWAASAARFREDSNAEDDLVRGGYRDRVVVELAQNAADAASRAGRPGRLSLALRDGELLASNTGAPLDAAGVESLSTLRASAKRDDRPGTTVGRFGVGFAAVLAVTDSPQVLSASGGVSWDAAAARDEALAVPALRDELSRRGGHVPVLRLPYPASGPPEHGFATTVRLPLRDGAAVDLVRRLLHDVDDALLLALQALDAIEIDVDGERRVVADDGRWHVVRRSGATEAHLLADRPVEERDRPAWSVMWARPLAGQAVPGTVHAPTPTDEPLDLPALLVASFPLDPTRRHVAPGPLADRLVGEAAAAYVALVLEVPDPSDRLRLVPGPVAAGRLDGALRSALTAALAAAPVLRTVSGEPVAPRDAVSAVGLGRAAAARAGQVVAGLVADDPVLERLGTRRLPLADLVDLLGDLDREPAWWHDLYADLADGAVDPEALAAVPVPLADGRLVRGPRGALLPGDGVPADASLLGLRLVHPDAAHPLLLRLGAAAATARTVLERPEVRQAVSGAWERDDPDAVVDAVLALVSAADLRPGELPWLRELRLVDEDGEPAAADELLLPGSPLAGLADPEVIGGVDAHVVARWGARALTAVGVLADLTVVEVSDVVLDPDAVEDDGPLPGLAEWAGWAAARLGPVGSLPSARTVRGIPELDVVDAGSWAGALTRVAGSPQLRAAVVDPVVVDLGGGRRALVPSHAAWWVRTHGRLAGRAPGEWAAPGASGLDGLYDVLDLVDVGAGAGPPDVDPALLAAVGVRTSLADLVGEPGGGDELLARLGDGARSVPPDAMRDAYRALAALAPESVAPPALVRVGTDHVLPHDDVVVVDVPFHLQLRWSRPPLVVPLAWAAALADVLDVARSSEQVEATVTGGEERPVPGVVRGVLAGAAPATWQEHDELGVAGRDVTWWVTEGGAVHAATLDGLARGLAWACGRWQDRLLVAALLSDPGRAGELLAEAALQD
jgi:hypothetical protein